jgi:hypothetical protein
LPDHADAISKVASRKGDGRSIGSALAQSVSPTTAAAILVVWSCRHARRPAIDALTEAFLDDPIFNDTIRTLCARIIPPTLGTVPTSLPSMTTAPIEVASPRRR